MCGSCPVASLSTEWGFLYSSTTCKRQNYTLPNWPMGLKYQLRVLKVTNGYIQIRGLPCPFIDLDVLSELRWKRCALPTYSYLVIRDGVKFRQQFDAIRPSDQNALQCLAVLLHLFRAHGPPESSELARWTRKSTRIVSVPALDPQQKCHRGWGKSRTPATHIQCSQTASALRDRSAAETDPGRTKVQNYNRVLQLRRHRPQPQHSAGMI